MFVINGVVVDDGITSVSECQDENIKLGCGYRPSPLTASDITFSYISGGTTTDLSLYQYGNHPVFILLGYTLTANEARGVRKYRCTARASPDVEVTIHFVEPTGKIL